MFHPNLQHKIPQTQTHLQQLVPPIIDKDVKLMNTIKSNATKDRVEIKLFADYNSKEEIGRLIVNVFSVGNECYSRIDYFYVKPEHRNQRNGKSMFLKAIAKLKKMGCVYLTVYPNPEPQKGEVPLSYEALYKIYNHLGFVFVNNTDEENSPNKEMRYEF